MKKSAPKRVGLLFPLAANDPEAQPRAVAFQQALHKLGWIEGRNVELEFRWAGVDPNVIATMAKELVDLAPRALVANTTPPAKALRQLTATMPIVFVTVTDPVGSGFAQSLARPGGNMTGLRTFAPSMAAAWLGMLKQVAPATARVGLLFNPDTAPYGQMIFEAVAAVAGQFALQAALTPVRSDAEIAAALVALGGTPGGGLIVLPDVFTTNHRPAIIARAAQYRLPAIHPFRFFATDGGLISYGADVIEQFQDAAGYIDRILRGGSPAEMPIQEPTTFQLVINLKTAAALGVTIPPELRARATEIIQ